MKRTFKNLVFAAAAVVFVSAAVATKAANAPKVQDPVYSWQHFDEDGNPIGLPSNKTLSGAQSDFGCSIPVATLCATGTRVVNGQPQTVRIYYPD